ncbi:S-adenosyl-L-methionine-dependent methyltransferase [Lipomyces oligophaga]|uniref:S-adenosyl-L-methionine-dependent methyltransferase n=1 Tax=Lipomyces oligophaga TaxID=45792 RepID=UPI0034CF2D1D
MASSSSRSAEPDYDSEVEVFEDLLNDNELEPTSDLTDDDETRPVCLFCKQTFEDASQVWKHCIEQHDFDFYDVTAHLNLDFFGKVKLINYVRSQVRSGMSIDLGSATGFLQDENYMKPVLQDDALLFGIDDNEVDGNGKGEEQPRTSSDFLPTKGKDDLQSKFDKLQLQFDEYKDMVTTMMRRQEQKSDSSYSSSSSDGDSPDDDRRPQRRRHRKAEKKSTKHDDQHYFDSYAYNEIHEVMLKDSIRTDSYRDAIYDNKDIFKDKIVLDVGCGTGILSMFAAKAGAKMVFAVDNSDIIDKAIANVYENGLDGVIHCYRGRIEELNLPIHQVDIIVSEWMGYGLLYEAMLDSVLFARDKYLSATGLMVPSECRMLVAGLRDPEFVNDKINYWNDVYGFKMTAMKPRIFDEVVIESFPPSSIVHSDPFVFKVLPLHSVSVSDLEFESPIRILLPPANSEFDGFLDGLVIYFDTYFTRSRDETVPEAARAESYRPGNGSLGFTTGPWGKSTHWRSGALMFNRPLEIEPGVTSLSGTLSYTKNIKNNREYIVKISLEGGKEKIAQTYFLR